MGEFEEFKYAILSIPSDAGAEGSRIQIADLSIPSDAEAEGSKIQKCNLVYSERRRSRGIFKNSAS